MDHRESTPHAPADIGLARFVAAYLVLLSSFHLLAQSWTVRGDRAMPALAWAITEHPGRTALALTMFGWALWNPSRHGPSTPRPDPVATDTNTRSDEGDRWAVGL